MNFERAIWKAVRSTLPGLPIKGCVLHWGQAVWRMIQELDLQVAYCQDDKIHHYCRMLMSLPFLPHEHIQPVFLYLEGNAEALQLQALMAYIRSTWIESLVWSPES